MKKVRSDKLTAPAPEDFAEALRARLTYDPTTGVFCFRSSGKRAGCLDKSTGYVRIRLWNVLYHAHRLAWVYIHGDWPADEIDHRSRATNDNSAANLRAATSSQNKMNQGKPVTNRSGFKGVCYDKERHLWRATIRAQGKWRQLGRFPTRELALQAYTKAALALQAEFYPEDGPGAGSPASSGCSA